MDDGVMKKTKLKKQNRRLREILHLVLFKCPAGGIYVNYRQDVDLTPYLDKHLKIFEE